MKILKMRAPEVFLLAILTLIACQKDDSKMAADGMEFFLLVSYQTIGQSCQIDERTIITEDEPVIFYPELLTYNPNTYTFELSESAKARIKALEQSTTGIAFAVLAGRQLVYTGYFWPGYSSASCNWVTIDPIFLDLGMTVKLGYPGPVDGQEIPDRRNDPAIIKILERDNKLIR